MSQRVLQLSDCHLPAQPGTLYHGRDADQTLTQLVQQLGQMPRFDLTLLTGDLVHHAGPDAYQRLLEQVALLRSPCHWLPGNHDDTAAMAAVDAGRMPGGKRLDLGRWTILLLNSTSNPDGRGSGDLATEELNWLQARLQQLQDRFVLLALHHNPTATGTPWQDATRLGNPDALEALVAAAPQVRGLICGHLHQAHALECAGRPLWSAPSTVVQFVAGSDRLEVETQPQLSTPGCRWYELQDDGRIDAHLVRLSTIEESMTHG